MPSKEFIPDQIIGSTEQVQTFRNLRDVCFFKNKSWQKSKSYRTCQLRMNMGNRLSEMPYSWGYSESNIRSGASYGCYICL